MSQDETKQLGEALAERIMNEGGDIRSKIPAAKRRDVEFLRAQIAYLTDPALRPAKFFFPMVEGLMALPSFLQRVTRAQWARRRERIFAQAQQSMVRRMTDGILTERMAEMRDLKKLRDNLFLLSMPEERKDTSTGEVRLVWPVEPKSLGEVVMAFTKVHELLDAQRLNVTSAVTAAVPPLEQKAGTADGPLEHETVVEVARTILERQVEEQRETIEAMKADDDDTGE